MNRGKHDSMGGAVGVGGLAGFPASEKGWHGTDRTAATVRKKSKVQFS